MKVAISNIMEFILCNVKNVPQIAKILILVRQFDDPSYTTILGKCSWVIKKQNIVIMRGKKHGSLYPMFVSLVDFYLYSQAIVIYWFVTWPIGTYDPKENENFVLFGLLTYP